MERPSRYNSHNRTAILTYLKDHADQHFTVDGIYSDLLKAGYHIGKTTVYRQLESLLDENIVRKFSSVERESSCYQYANGDCLHLFHCKCTNCGRLFHVHCDLLDEVNSHLQEDHSFYVDPAKTVFFGFCSDCVSAAHGGTEIAK